MKLARPISESPLEALVANHRRFLRFLERRVRDRATAEEILQAAFTRGFEKAGAIRSRETSVAWFYRLLRNALVDYYRARVAEGAALDRYGRELLSAPDRVDPTLQRTVCACVGDLVTALKPEYSQILQRVDLDGAPVAAAASELHVTPNNAMVRLHRARRALKKKLEVSCGSCATHGCLDCGCKAGVARPSAGDERTRSQ